MDVLVFVAGAALGVLVARARAAVIPSGKPRITGIVVYPVKALRGVPQAAATLSEYGLQGDRSYVIARAGEPGLPLTFVSQRGIPLLARLSAALLPRGAGVALDADAPSAPARIEVPLVGAAQAGAGGVAVVAVRVWEDVVEGW